MARKRRDGGTRVEWQRDFSVSFSFGLGLVLGRILVLGTTECDKARAFRDRKMRSEVKESNPKGETSNTERMIYGLCFLS